MIDKRRTVRRHLGMQFFKGHWQLLLITALVFLAWSTPLVFPLKILVIFLHELSHAGAAILTGGSVEAISLSAAQGGHAITRGGNLFLILSAGYLGSLLLGMALLLIALRTDADRIVMGGFGVVTLGVAALYIRDLFPLVFCVLTGAAMLAMARYLSHQINDLALRVIGLTSLIYVPYDIFDDTIRRSSERSDAFMLAEHFFGSAMFWGGIWLVLSVAVIVASLRYGFNTASNISFGKGNLT